MITRPIPRTGEALPVVGLGTWQTFDVRLDEAARARLGGILRRFHDAGGRVVDSSPMYGRSEEVVGRLSADLGINEALFLASKVWTTGRAEGLAQAEQSLARMRRRRLDLLQVHNLVDLAQQLATLRALKRDGRVRYVGVTHYTTGSLPELARLVRAEALDFVQLPYSLGVRDAERELLPACADSGTAVLVNRPFEEGALFRRVKGRALPDVAAEIGASGWGAFFLKFIVSHPAVTCVLPATGDPRHLEDNLGAGFGPLPDAALRARMARWFDGTDGTG